MKKSIHASILRAALATRISPQALAVITTANLGQDALRYQVGHDHFHFDANSFERGNAYLAEQREIIFSALKNNNPLSAQQAFGRLSHAVQDFYAHSNYVSMWRELNPDLPHKEIDPLVEELINSPRLHSGNLYYPLEVLTFIPPLEKYITPLLPKDSHAQMNLDDGTKPNFHYAFWAAVKRTMWEFENVIGNLSDKQLSLFQVKNS